MLGKYISKRDPFIIGVIVIIFKKSTDSPASPEGEYENFVVAEQPVYFVVGQKSKVCCYSRDMFYRHLGRFYLLSMSYV